MMYTSFSTGSLFPLEPEKAAIVASDAGYRHIELFINCDYEQSDDYIDLFLPLLEEKGLKVGSFHPYLSGTESYILFSDYPRRRREAIETYERSLRAASRLGAKYFILHGPGRPAPAFREPYPYELDVYRELCAYGASVGVEVLQENVKLFLSAFPAFFRVLSEEVPELGFNLDLKQAAQSGQSYEEMIAVMGSRIKNVHINDLDVSGRCRLPGDGLINYQHVFSLLDDVGYDGALVTEVYRSDFEDYDRLQISRQFLESELAKFRIIHQKFS